MLKASIEKFGQPRPLLARAENRMLIAGHGVLQAMLELGRPEIDALLWDCDQRTADQFLLADNRLAELSEVDLDRRRSLLDGLDEEDFPALGFLSADVEQLFGRDREIEVAEVEVGEVRDEFWISVRGPLAQQAPVLQKLTELLAEFRGVVDVELGTIAVE